MSEALFFVGQLIEHRLFDYRGVIVGVDHSFNLTEDWYDSVAKSRPPRDEPWYQVLVDHALHTTYVAERNLKETENKQQIEHPLLGEYFDRFDGERYYLHRQFH